MSIAASRSDKREVLQAPGRQINMYWPNSTPGIDQRPPEPIWVVGEICLYAVLRQHYQNPRVTLTRLRWMGHLNAEPMPRWSAPARWVRRSRRVNHACLITVERVVFGCGMKAPGSLTEPRKTRSRRALCKRFQRRSGVSRGWGRERIGGGRSTKR